MCLLFYRIAMKKKVPDEHTKAAEAKVSQYSPLGFFVRVIGAVLGIIIFWPVILKLFLEDIRDKKL